jgi:serine/threonine protein kinase
MLAKKKRTGDHYAIKVHQCHFSFTFLCILFLDCCEMNYFLQAFWSYFDVVMQIMNKRKSMAKNFIDQIKAERNIMAEVDNPWVVKLYYSFQTPRFLCLVMEYLNGRPHTPHKGSNQKRFVCVCVCVCVDLNLYSFNHDKFFV